jgi:hypothetical protein
MASIKIESLKPAGSILFEDFESFLNELGDEESLAISGGLLDVLSVASLNSDGGMLSGNHSNVGISQTFVTQNFSINVIVNR